MPLIQVILNKITAKTSEFEVNIDDTIEFGRLIITARKCWQAPLDQRPESKILLEVDEVDAKNRINRIFFAPDFFFNEIGEKCTKYTHYFSY